MTGVIQPATNFNNVTIASSKIKFRGAVSFAFL